MEKIFKHTPSPWAVKIWDGYKAQKSHIIYPANCEKGLINEAYIAKVNWFPYDDNFKNETEAGIANAKLIAAAPDLLDACLRAYFVLTQSNDTPLVNDITKIVSDAIKKATN